MKKLYEILDCKNMLCYSILISIKYTNFNRYNAVEIKKKTFSLVLSAGNT